MKNQKVNDLQARCLAAEEELDGIHNLERALCARFNDPAVQTANDVWNAYHAMEGRARTAEAIINYAGEQSRGNKAPDLYAAREYIAKHGWKGYEDRDLRAAREAFDVNRQTFDMGHGS